MPLVLRCPRQSTSLALREVHLPGYGRLTPRQPAGYKEVSWTTQTIMKMLVAFLCAAITALVGAQSQPEMSTSQGPMLVQTVPHCADGLYRQPGGGALAVVLFDCSSALGVTIGVVCFHGDNVDCMEPPWSEADRFWQEERWARDVTGFAWDPAGRCLYVSTSEIYGSGDLFTLDLKRRRVTAVPLNIKGRLVAKGRYSTFLKGIDPKAGTLRYETEYFDGVTSRTRTDAVSIAAPCKVNEGPANHALHPTVADIMVGAGG
jgi:hypothetical protein